MNDRVRTIGPRTRVQEKTGGIDKSSTHISYNGVVSKLLNGL